MKRITNDTWNWVNSARKTIRELIIPDIMDGVVDEEYLARTLSMLLNDTKSPIRAKIALLTVIQMGVYTKDVVTGKIIDVLFLDSDTLALCYRLTERNWKKKHKFEFFIQLTKDNMLIYKDPRHIEIEKVKISPYYYKRKRGGKLVVRKEGE